MFRKAAEAHHHTPEQVSEALAEAKRICEAHGVDFPRHEDIVCALLTQLLSKQVWYEQVTPAGVVLNNVPPQG